MRFETVFFDLDGTLTDPGLGITNSVMYALEKLGYAVPPRQELYRFIGPPLLDSFMNFYDMDEAKAEEAIRLYRERFSVTGKFENQVYPGIPELLQKLKDAGCRLVVATSKPEEFSVDIVEHFGLAGYFDAVCGSTMDHSRGSKGKVIAYALESRSIDPATVIMVGDREHDVLGARENGLPCIGVSYGYGSREELETSGAVAVADSPAALFTALEEL